MNKLPPPPNQGFNQDCTWEDIKSYYGEASKINPRHRIGLRWSSQVMLMACIMEMRKEYQRTKQIPKMHQYFRAYNIGIIANRLIEPLIIAPTNPTIGDIMSLRSKINKEIKFAPNNKDSLISQLRIIKTQLQQFGIDVEIKLTQTVKQTTLI